MDEARELELIEQEFKKLQEALKILKRRVEILKNDKRDWANKCHAINARWGRCIRDVHVGGGHIWEEKPPRRGPKCD